MPRGNVDIAKHIKLNLKLQMTRYVSFGKFVNKLTTNMKLV